MSSGRRRRVPLGTVAILTDPAGVDEPRLGLAVPSSVGGAVVRNRIKRRLRAAFVAAELPAGAQVVIRPRLEAASLGFQELENSLREAAA